MACARCLSRSFPGDLSLLGTLSPLHGAIYTRSGRNCCPVSKNWVRLRLRGFTSFLLVCPPPNHRCHLTIDITMWREGCTMFVRFRFCPQPLSLWACRELADSVTFDCANTSPWRLDMMAVLVSPMARFSRPGLVTQCYAASLVTVKAVGDIALTRKACPLW